MTDLPIVVGYDGSPGSREALDFALATALPPKAALDVVHVWQPPPPPTRFAGPSGPSAQTLQAVAGQVLAEALDHARHAAPAAQVGGRLAEGRPAETLIENGRGAAMIVLGSRGLGGFGNLLLGSTGIQVASHARCPVVILRPRDAAATVGPDAGRVVVGVDGSASSEAAVAFALEQASWARVGVTAMLSLDLLGIPGPGELTPLDVLEADAGEGAALLAESLAGWQESYPDVEIRTRIVSERPAPALVAASIGAHLLVVGTRGLGGFRSLMLGSVSHAVLHHAQGPVAVVSRHARVA